MEHEVVVDPWRDGDDLVRPVTAYHLATEAEKGRPAGSVADLSGRYRREIDDPAAALP